MTIAYDRETVDQTNRRTGLKVGVPKEIFPGECRVAATPETVKTLEKMGFQVLIEAGAGAAAHFSDEAYRQVGCQIMPGAESLWHEADIILKVRSPLYNEATQHHEADLLSAGKTLISFIYPAQNAELLQQLAERQATVLAMDSVPRISRAQKMDALSSMANLAGYRAIIEAANQYGRCFTGQITAAGKMPPTKVLIIGAGVAGLAAVGAARGLGAIVRAFDTRPVVQEQVQSLGAEFLQVELEEDGSGQGGYAKEMSKEFIEAEMALFAEQAKDVDIIVTTALIPGKKAPLLITQEMVESMKPGSVIVDMAAEQGGNCAVTRPNEIYRYHGVSIIGLTDLPSRMATQASQLYGTNLCHLLKDMGGAEQFHVDLEDEVVRGALVLNQGEITYPPPKPAAAPAPAAPTVPAASTASVETKATQQATLPWNVLFPILATVALVGLGSVAPQSFLSHFTVFVLACFVGWQVVWNVKPALHTPLMSVTNAISGIIILGGMLQVSGSLSAPTTVLGAIAVLIGTINISGGFLVTQRMLKMFQR
jgi:H+-translocating NAD(P) transhydrogenase subunit alpha